MSCSDGSLFNIITIVIIVIFIIIINIIIAISITIVAITSFLNEYNVKLLFDALLSFLKILLKKIMSNYQRRIIYSLLFHL